MSLLSARTAVAQAVRDADLGFATVTTHGGRFDQTELKRWMRQTPAALVVLLGVPATEIQAGTSVARARFAVFVVTSDERNDPRDARAITFTESVMNLVTGNRWDGAACKAPERLQGSNLYSKSLDRGGVAIWAVTWEQLVDIEPNSPDDLDDFETFHADWLVQGDGDDDTVDAEDTVTLEVA